MTATAQGRPMQCDQAACTRPATVEHQAWMFCDEHGAASRTLAAQVDHANPSAPPRPVRAVPTPPAANAPSPAASSISGPRSLGQLLKHATGHTVPKVQRLADKVERLLDDLRSAIEEHEAGEAARRAEREQKEKARAEVARLEAELAAAKARLTGKPSKPKAAPSTPGLCVDCGTPIVREPGKRGVLPKRCPAHRPAVKL